MKREALAIFAKSPVPGEVKTRLTPPLTLEQGAELYRCMLLDTVARVGSLSVDAFIFYHGDADFFSGIAPGVPLVPQRGAGLGERLEAAFDELSLLGYRSRVVIGTDAPDLPLGFIEEAFARLRAGKGAVFGPAEDGGYYLAGVRSGYGSLFRDIPWSGPRVLETSLARAGESGLAASLLPSWYDVDEYDDLFRPGLSDPANGATFTRDFIAALSIGPCPAADAV